jgi:hypothetical protein
MKLFGFNISKDKLEGETFQSFSTPFATVGGANLSLPHVDGIYREGTYVPFGSNNLYPQLINQLYFTSPLHSSVTDFKCNSTLGGGYELKVEGLTTKQRVDVEAFKSRLKLDKTIKNVTLDVILHKRVYFIGTKLKTGAKIKRRVCPSKVRNNKNKSIYFLCDDWSKLLNVSTIKRYKDTAIGEDFIYCYEMDSVGQDIYSLPSYTSANNWMFLDGEMSYLQKSSILNSIFPSFAAKFPKKPQGSDEMNMIKTTLEKLKGAENAGKVAAFFANRPEDLPTFETIATNSNDNLFQNTTESIDSKICQAHVIDPILMGIRVSGKLGSGSDIKQAYVIFEKNTIMPLRNEIESIFNELFKLSNMEAKLNINDFQIINETIIETDDEVAGGTIDALNSMSPLVATKVLETLTPNEIRALAGLLPVEGGDLQTPKL